MFYLAVLLILLGILVFIYSISVEKVNHRTDLSPTRPGPPAGTYYRAETRDADSRQVRSLYDEMDDGDLPSMDLSLTEDSREAPLLKERVPRSANPDADDEAVAAFKASPESDDKSPNAVLFEDSSGAFDYSVLPVNGVGNFDALGAVRRIGEGRLSPEKNGISFHMKNRLYRFDYHRIEGLNFGDGFLAVNSGNSAPVRFFIVNGSSHPLEQINSDYSVFMSDPVRK